MHDIFHRAKVVQNELIGNDVRYLVLSLPSPLSFLPGQFFILRLRDEKGELVERSYSVASAKQDGLLEFIIRIVEHGKMSTLIDQLIIGQSIDVKGPFGRFGMASLPADFKTLILIGGGVGISPLRSMIQSTFLKEETYPLQLFYGFRKPRDFLFQKEFEAYAREERFELYSSISDVHSPEWDGNVGYISSFLEDYIFPPSKSPHCFICGPPPMVKATRERLFELGFERPQVHVEAW